MMIRYTGFQGLSLLCVSEGIPMQQDLKWARKGEKIKSTMWTSTTAGLLIGIRTSHPNKAFTVSASPLMYGMERSSDYLEGSVSCWKMTLKLQMRIFKYQCICSAREEIVNSSELPWTCTITLHIFLLANTF